MSDPYLGEIRMFAGNFNPRGWAFCDGQLLATSSNDALFSLLGTVYGGDGRSTFALPDLRGRLPIHQDQGPGLSPRRLGQRGGSENVTITTSQMPSHNHGFESTTSTAESVSPAGKVFATAPFPLYTNQNNLVSNLASESVTNSGGSRAHTNLMPSLCINFIIALVGIYPSRN